MIEPPRASIYGLAVPDTSLIRHWHLDEDVVFLNHGSFGACPKVVLQVQDALRLELEREPVHFIGRELSGLLDAARERLASFVCNYLAV